MTLPWDSALAELEKLRGVLEASPGSLNWEIKMLADKDDSWVTLDYSYWTQGDGSLFSSHKNERNFATWTSETGWRLRTGRQWVAGHVIAEIRKLNEELGEG